MAHETESLMSSPLSISGVESISDVNSIVNVREHGTPVPNTLEHSEDTLFDSGDGDIRLVVCIQCKHVILAMTWLLPGQRHYS